MFPVIGGAAARVQPIAVDELCDALLALAAMDDPPASVMLIFRRDFKEAAGIFAVGLLAVLLATPSGLNLLRNTAALIFGGQ